MTTAVNTLLSQIAGSPSTLSALTEQPEQLGAKLGFNAAQLSALRSADRFERPMRPVTFTTGTTISV
ncbi:hypothetical protein [Paenibacillus mucilaginosus]|uniref:Uncharacterized protein n=3 Tax=Paenibacillus mucilaginosus TaxID=61624 RepID=H6NI28_9BACL|nr:hypothetical protein [Paenibacillus mucilaginosus]AEI43133.1 hypothetical protein KNP414_04603 [Paenibacillus mucilaginosus KNP414]AFC30799.1 hypothetical protein PM3016_4015 [Paenibacillus mucilaginosus 3016]AFH63122.1 hypothetical protein B2K_20865 [Paenibacillus mucilaginosus K02]MCG7212300.1 hypothetical protein [Paenibacillus mucilaginosus]WDM24739.1 hypothetical protein KCX80_19785 [Paenibacillus mucilaginosus]